MIIHDYDSKIFDFCSEISKTIGVECLQNIHQIRNYDVFSRRSDQSTIWHKIYYDNFYKLEKLYFNFIKKNIKPLFNDQVIVYQKIPSLRIHLVGNLAVGEFHKDKHYNHDENEINFWLPLVDTWGNNSIWVESVEDRGDYHPVKLNYGQYIEFDGANLSHGNKINDTPQSRLSIDFRVVPFSKFSYNEKFSINTNKKFDIGEYFDIMI